MRTPTIQQIKERNIKNGGKFFDRETMRFSNETMRSFRVVRDGKYLFIERKRDGFRWEINEKTGRCRRRWPA